MLSSASFMLIEKEQKKKQKSFPIPTQPTIKDTKFYQSKHTSGPADKAARVVKPLSTFRRPSELDAINKGKYGRYHHRHQRYCRRAQLISHRQRARSRLCHTDDQQIKNTKTQKILPNQTKKWKTKWTFYRGRGSTFLSGSGLNGSSGRIWRIGRRGEGDEMVGLDRFSYEAFTA